MLLFVVCPPLRSVQSPHLPLCVCVAGVGPSRAVAEAAHVGRGQAEVVRVEDVVDAAQPQVRDPDEPTVIAVAVAAPVVVGTEPVADGVPHANLELNERREWQYEAYADDTNVGISEEDEDEMVRTCEKICERINIYTAFGN